MNQPDLLITGATLIDGTTTPPMTDAELLIHRGRIAQIAPAGTIEAAHGTSNPQAVQVIDAHGLHVMPGFIDCHVHADTFPDRSAYDSLTDHATAVVLRTVPVLQTWLHSGVTTARDLAGADAGTRACIEEGVIDGPRLQVALRILSVTGGHGDWRSISGIDLAGPAGGGQVADGPDEFRRAVRDVVREGGDWIKVATSGGMGSPRSNPDNGGLRADELTAVVSEAAHQGLVGVAAHAQGSAGIRAAVEAGVRSIEHGYGLDAATIELMGEKGIWLVPTLTTLLRPIVEDPQRPWVAARRREWQERARTNLAAAFAAGVRVAAGTDAGIVAHGTSLHELGHLVELGLSPLDALRAATSEAAALLGLDHETGSLTVGHSADVVALSVDPLAQPRQAGDAVKLVISRGQLVRNELTASSN